MSGGRPPPPPAGSAPGRRDGAGRRGGGPAAGGRPARSLSGQPTDVGREAESGGAATRSSLRGPGDAVPGDPGGGRMCFHGGRREPLRRTEGEHRSVRRPPDPRGRPPEGPSAPLADGRAESAKDDVLASCSPFFPQISCARSLRAGVGETGVHGAGDAWSPGRASANVEQPSAAGTRRACTSPPGR
ncbi:hypothetical protein R6Z07F_017036 [Ovis aries]